MIHFEAPGTNLAARRPISSPNCAPSSVSSLPRALALLIVLMIAGRASSSLALLACAAVVALSFLSLETRLTPAASRRHGKRGGEPAMIAACCACVGITSAS
ncbi:MAG: hypothetical protein ACLSHC_05225 [Bilophila wadsworthia]